MPPLIAPLLVGTAGTAAGAAVVGTAATAGLFGTAGAFALPQALITAKALGIGTSIFGTLQAGAEAEAAGESQAAWDEYNAKLAERQATEEQEAAAAEERKLRKGAARGKAEARTKFGQAGVTFEGSPMDFLEEFASEVEKDALEIRRGGTVGAREQLASATLSRGLGRSAILKGRAKRRASRTQALGLGLAGFGGLYG